MRIFQKRLWLFGTLGFLLALAGCPGPTSPALTYCTSDNDCGGQGKCDTKISVCVAVIGEAIAVESSLPDGVLNEEATEISKESPEEAQAEAARESYPEESASEERRDNEGKPDDAGTSEGSGEPTPEGECTPGQTRPCYDGIEGCKSQSDGSYSCQGSCKTGIQTCDPKGFWGGCQGAILPQPAELCNGQDDDCNGKTDDAVKEEGEACDTPKPGECKTGSKICVNGVWSCKPTFEPRDEVCDGKDNDCDGHPDNQPGGSRPLERPCEPAPKGCSESSAACTGTCKRGTQICQHGAWELCKDQQGPQTEICDGLDNDCDGQIDNGIAPQDCYTGPSGTQGIGLCKAGQKLCTQGTWGACQDETTPKTESCDGLDNDCDGQTDEGCQCQNGARQPCYTGPPEPKTKAYANLVSKSVSEASGKRAEAVSPRRQRNATGLTTTATARPMKASPSKPWRVR